MRLSRLFYSIRTAAALVAVVFIPLAGCAKKNPDTLLLEQFATGFVGPSYELLADTTTQLSSDVSSCSNIGRAEFLTQARASWRTAMASWQVAQTIKFGPVKQQRLDWEFQFWPDKNNLIAKKALPLLTSTEALKDDQLANSSVALKGFGAMEFLLFDPIALDQAQPQRYCELVTWVGKSLADTGQVAMKSWFIFAPEFTQEASKHTGVTDQLAPIFEALMDNAETIARAKLSPVLSSSKANSYLLESWRSQNSLANIQNNLDALEKMLVKGGITNYLQAKNMGPAQQKLSASLKRAQGALAQIGAPIETSAGRDHGQLTVAFEAITEFRTTVTQQVVTDLQLPIGFNDNDGD